MKSSQHKFELGEIVVTPGASAALQAHGHNLDTLLARHQTGDWGDISDHQRAVNERGLAESFNVQSSYKITANKSVVIVTNRERTLTIVHLL